MLPVIADDGLELKVVLRVGDRVVVVDVPDIFVGVADSPVFYVVRLGVAVLRAERTVFGLFRSVQIFKPVQKLLSGASGCVDCYDWLCAREFAEAHEFVRAEIVTPDGISIVRHGVHPRWAYLSDAVLPVVMVGAASARPTHCADSELTAPIDDIQPNTVDVGDFAVFSNPNPVIYDTPEILEEDGMDES